MKAIKTLALTLIALVSMTACTSDSDHDQTLTNTYSSYVYASFSYAQNYYSGTGEVIIKVHNGVYTITAKNSEWGEAIFENVVVGDNITGNGVIKVLNAHTGDVTKKAAQLSGTLTELTITVPGLMQGGTTIEFYIGHIPATKLAGTYSGTNSVQVGNNEDWTYTADISYEITANEDGTINIIVPEYTLEGTMMGDLTLGTYTISNIQFNQELGTYFCAYGYDELQMNFKTTEIDRDYYFSYINPTSNITIQPKNGMPGVKVKNTFGLGVIEEGVFQKKMPYTITATFEGNIARAK